MTIMKPETLREKRRYVHKMDFYVDRNAYAQVLDSHLELYNKVAELESDQAQLRQALELAKNALDIAEVALRSRIETGE